MTDQIENGVPQIVPDFTPIPNFPPALPPHVKTQEEVNDEFEARLDTLEQSVDEFDYDEFETLEQRVSEMEDNVFDEDSIEEWFERYMRNQDWVSEQDLDRRLEDELPDMDDYVRVEDLQSAIEEQLEELDLVQQVASGAAQGAMEKMNQYAKHERMDKLEKVVAMQTEHLALFSQLTLWGRVRWVLTGKL
jgi:hypothetical protein